MAKKSKKFERKQVLVEAELADRFKIVLHNKDMHAGHFYCEDEWAITVYAPTIEDLIAQATASMLLQPITVDGWELEQCQVLIYDGRLYEVEHSAKDVKEEYSTLVDDIISTDLYKEAWKIRQEEIEAGCIRLRKRLRKQKVEDQKAREKAREKK